MAVGVPPVQHARLPPLRRYVAVDGGAGAHLLAMLAGADPRLQPVASPRHAGLLLVFEPVTPKLLPALAAFAAALPRPAQALLVGEAPASRQPSAAGLEVLLDGAARVPARASEIIAAALERSWRPLRVAYRERVAGSLEPATVPLPPPEAREMATEPAVVSLGPIQELAAGPVRLILICDGEQVHSARVDAGYAHRGIGAAMAHASWAAAAALAAQLDPLAPVAGRLAFVRAVEQLQRRAPSGRTSDLREAALALERAQSHLWWLTRFAQALAAAPLATRAAALALAIGGASRPLTEGLAGWLAPVAEAPSPGSNAAMRLVPLAEAVSRLQREVEHDRLLALRTRGIGQIAAEQLHQVRASGPALRASRAGTGDVHGRLLTRLQAAAADLLEAVARIADHRGGAEQVGPPPTDDAHVPPGEAHVEVEGPRGTIALTLRSDGGAGPAGVEWRRPSAALLQLLPATLAGQKLGDVAAIVASLDLSMAEADG